MLAQGGFLFEPPGIELGRALKTELDAWGPGFLSTIYSTDASPPARWP